MLSLMIRVKLSIRFTHLFKTLAFQQVYDNCMKRVVSKETVVLHRWGSSIQKFGFINGVDNVNWPPYRDSKS